MTIEMMKNIRLMMLGESRYVRNSLKLKLIWMELITSYKIVKENEFAYVADTPRRGDKIAVAFNRNEGNILISSIYTVFMQVIQITPFRLFIYVFNHLNLIVIHDLILGV